MGEYEGGERARETKGRWMRHGKGERKRYLVQCKPMRFFSLKRVIYFDHHLTLTDKALAPGTALPKINPVWGYKQDLDEILFSQKLHSSLPKKKDILPD